MKEFKKWLNRICCTKDLLNVVGFESQMFKAYKKGKQVGYLEGYSKGLECGRVYARIEMDCTRDTVKGIQGGKLQCGS